MNRFHNSPRRLSSLVSWLDDVQMSEGRRSLARNQLQMTESLIDGVWSIAAGIRAAIARATARRVEPEFDRREPSIRWH